MQPQEAYNILNNVTANIPMVRSDQAKVLQALEVFKSLIATPSSITPSTESQDIAKDRTS